MPAGYGDSEQPDIWEGFGLGQRDRLNRVATDTYAGALERMMRPRMILDLERRMPDIIRSGETTDIYRALKNHFDPDNLMNPGGTLGIDLPEDQKRDFINK